MYYMFLDITASNAEASKQCRHPVVSFIAHPFNIFA